MNLDLFHAADTCIPFALPDADICYYPGFLSSNDANESLAVLKHQVNWQQDIIKVYGKEYTEPRLTAWYADKFKDYTYSGLVKKANPWLPELLKIKQAVEELSSAKFNSVLINYYRDQNDSVGWHADDEKELGHNPVIASVSLGETRKFQLKHKHDKMLRQNIELDHGSLLLMAGSTQHFWQHQVPKLTNSIGPRINLTFRWVE